MADRIRTSDAHVKVKIFSDECSSFIGRDATNINEVNFSGDCLDLHNILRHFVHTLGFDREHQRADREEYFSFQSDRAHAELFVVNNSTWNTPYDFRSVLHGSQNLFNELRRLILFI